MLILDDYHTIGGNAIHDALTYLLDHVPPQLHLTMTTRVDPPLPLARMRVRGEMTDIRATDLRFTQDEAAAFLRHHLPRSSTFCFTHHLTAALQDLQKKQKDGSLLHIS